MTLRLPAWLIDPFDLRCVFDDVHAMAYFVGHPQWEAVEVMLRRASSGWVARAILTQHDQSQVDCINDESLFRAAQASGRRTLLTPIDLRTTLEAERPAVEARFASPDGHAVAFRVVAAAPADRARGGVSDPGDHAARSSLPVMLRGASALAGPGSWVEVDGAAYLVPETFRAGPFVAVRGSFTLDHRMAILRAGARTLGAIEAPSARTLGARWTWGENGPAIDDAVGRRAEEGGATRIPSNDRARQLQVRPVAPDAWSLDAVGAFDARQTTAPGARLDFREPGSFTLSVGDVPALRGSVRALGDDGVELIPEHPDWARRRVVRTRWRLEGDSAVVTTTIGP